MFRNKVVTERATHLIVNNHNIVVIYNSLRIVTTLYLWLINRNFNNNSGLGCSGSGCGSSSTNLLGNCSFNRLRISLFCFSYSALNLVLVCHRLVCLLSLNYLISLNNLSSIHLVPSSDVAHNGNGHPSFRVLFCARILHIIGSLLLSLLFSLGYIPSGFSCSIFFSLHGTITSLKTVKLFNIFYRATRFTHSLFHLTILKNSSL